MSTSESTASKVILIYGATGNIGKVVIEELSRSAHPLAQDFTLVALTRDANSASTRRLAALPQVITKQIPADGMDKPGKAVAALGYEKGSVYGVFSCQGYVTPKEDTAQGIAIADMCADLGVQHLVYLSTNFGSAPDTGTEIFECKRRVETHLSTLSIPHVTLLHPAQFMDNLLPSAPTFLRMGRTLLIHHAFKTHPERKHQMVSTRDIGIAGARAFEEPGRWKVLDLAGDEIDMVELQQTYREVMGEEVDTPLGLRLVTGMGRRFIGTPRGVADFFDKIGYNVDIPQCRKDFPQVETLRQFFERNKPKEG
ncbi:uncharacterized protein MKK02DRAFT_43857 [Dioszegia hungarica]|uniref:NmrA-like domain-containing protein n=1 Tax=Dioszegia hungarica TaxID=4972 RepID=A0AA38H977_9TREE|nr:uncharacterized protein MKK02DRAFT_43857 [Dioszegia hungarica]KAI9635179.1 hypothetical protein MKK02DRAFT_43857 [Dioszegia hungarica]